MLRRFVALAALGLAGAMMLPDPGLAAGGMRGFPGGGFRAGGFRAPLIINRFPRTGILHAVPRPLVLPRAHGPRALGRAFHRGFGAHVRATHGPHAHLRHEFGRRTLVHARAHLARRHHRIYHSGWTFPVTVGDGFGFIGTPYDPSEAIPVYAPQPDTAVDEAPPVPQLSAREENPACRSERVTVPASGGGERGILIVRC
jgi:hypothetical protein